MAEFSRPDLCIIGAGALGIKLALYARQLGASVVLAERGVPEPGDEPQRALRLSALAASASAVAALRRGASMGLGAVDAKISFKAIQERVTGVVAESALESSAELLAAQGVILVSGDVRFLDQKTVQAGDIVLRPRHVVVATGGTPQVPGVPGLDEIEYFTLDSIYLNLRKLTHLLVIGGDGEGLAVAQAYRRLGSQVTLVPQGPLLPEHDAESVAILLRALAGEGMTVLEGGHVRAIQPRAQGTGALVQTRDGQEQALDVSHVLVAAGRRPDFSGLDLENAKLRALKGQETRFASGPMGQTSNRFVRVVGHAAGIAQWHQALVHGRAVIDSLLLGPSRRPLPIKPLLVMTEPALAQIGALPGAGDRAGTGQVLVRANLAENDRARALGLAHGAIKVIATSGGRVRGASVVGADAGELAGVLALAMERKVTLADFAGLAVPHPSLMGSLAVLGQNYLALRPVSSWMAGIRAVRQALPW